MKIIVPLAPSVLGGFNANLRQALLSLERDYHSTKDDNERQSILNSIFYFIEFQSYLNMDMFKDFSDEDKIESAGGAEDATNTFRNNSGEPMA